MYKITEVIERPRTGVVEDLPLDDYVACLGGLAVADRIEVGLPLDVAGLPEPDHAMVVEAWFTDLETARSVPDQPGFARLDELATAIHEAGGIRRYFSVVSD